MAKEGGQRVIRCESRPCQALCSLYLTVPCSADFSFCSVFASSTAALSSCGTRRRLCEKTLGGNKACVHEALTNCSDFQSWFGGACPPAPSALLRAMLCCSLVSRSSALRRSNCCTCACELCVQESKAATASERGTTTSRTPSPSPHLQLLIKGRILALFLLKQCICTLHV